MREHWLVFILKVLFYLPSRNAGGWSPRFTGGGQCVPLIVELAVELTNGSITSNVIAVWVEYNFDSYFFIISLNLDTGFFNGFVSGLCALLDVCFLNSICLIERLILCLKWKRKWNVLSRLEYPDTKYNVLSASLYQVLRAMCEIRH